MLGRKEMAKAISEEMGWNYPVCLEVVDVLMGFIKKGLMDEETINLNGIGKLFVFHAKDRWCCTRTGDRLWVENIKIPKFKLNGGFKKFYTAQRTVTKMENRVEEE